MPHPSVRLNEHITVSLIISFFLSPPLIILIVSRCREDKLCMTCNQHNMWIFGLRATRNEKINRERDVYLTKTCNLITFRVLIQDRTRTQCVGWVVEYGINSHNSNKQAVIE